MSDTSNEKVREEFHSNYRKSINEKVYQRILRDMEETPEDCGFERMFSHNIVTLNPQEAQDVRQDKGQ